MTFDPRHKSHTLVDGPSRAPARSYFKSVGFTSDDLQKPFVMVAHEWIGTMPCNFNQRALAQRVMAGVRAAGGALTVIRANRPPPNGYPEMSRAKQRPVDLARARATPSRSRY